MTANVGFVVAACLLLSGCVAAVGANPVEPVGFTQVRITGGLWDQQIETNAKSTLPHVLEQCRKTGRISNFEIAAGKKTGEHQGYFFKRFGRIQDHRRRRLRPVQPQGQEAREVLR